MLLHVVCLYLCISETVCRSWRERFAASGELTRRLPPDPVDSDHPVLSWYACLVALTWGRQKKKREEWEEYRDRKNRRQWMIMMTRAILLASVEDNPPLLPLCTRPHPPPWPWLWLPHGRVIWLRSACVGVGEVSPPGRVCSVSCWVWLEKRRGQDTRDKRSM